MKPLISVIHPTIRVNTDNSHYWANSMADWYAKSSSPSNVEYIVAVPQHLLNEFWYWNGIKYGVPHWGGFHVVCNNSGDSHFVTQVNLGASRSTGRMLCVTQDDLFPPNDWDKLLLGAVPDLDNEYVVHCSTGLPRDPELMNAGCVTRKRYERYGYLCYPEYESLYEDDDRTAVAYKDGVVIPRLDIQFEHRHFGVGKSKHDDVYAIENRREAAELGKKVFERRKACNFAY